MAATAFDTAVILLNFKIVLLNKTTAQICATLHSNSRAEYAMDKAFITWPDQQYLGSSLRGQIPMEVLQNAAHGVLLSCLMDLIHDEQTDQA